MVRTVEAIVDQNGQVQLLERVALSEARRALVTILDEPALTASEAAILSEPALDDWNRPEEEQAWSSLQPPGQ